MPPWIKYLNLCQKEESIVGPSNFVQLATVGIDYTPRVRTVVFRGWSNNYEMEILTDKRSNKYKELEFVNSAEVCWLFKKTNCQFRFRGNSYYDDGERTNYYWNSITDRSKSMWTWPHPGKAINSEFYQPLKDVSKCQRLDNFILLKIAVNYVDLLILSNPIHYRKKWVKEAKWIEQRINP